MINNTKERGRVAMLKYAALEELINEITSVHKNQLKAYKWAAVTAGNDITQTDLAGIVITGSGTLVLVGSDDSELDCGTVSADPINILPFCPKKVKTGSTATVKAIYGA